MAEFLLGLVSGIILLLVGQRITRAYRKLDDHAAVLDDIAEKYHALRQSNQTSGAHGLIQSGIYRARTSQEIEQVVAKIQDLGHSDPLGPNREGLQGKDILHFFAVLRDNQLNPLQLSDLNRAYELTSASSQKFWL